MSDLDELEQQTQAMLAAAGPLVLSEIKHMAIENTFTPADPLTTAYREGVRSVFVRFFELLPENQDAQLH